jgi:hypothetical protein
LYRVLEGEEKDNWYERSYHSTDEQTHASAGQELQQLLDGVLRENYYEDRNGESARASL